MAAPGLGRGARPRPAARMAADSTAPPRCPTAARPSLAAPRGLTPAASGAHGPWSGGPVGQHPGQPARASPCQAADSAVGLVSRLGHYGLPWLATLWTGFALTLLFYVLPDTEGGVLERVVPFLATLIVATAAELWGTRESGA